MAEEKWSRGHIIIKSQIFWRGETGVSATECSLIAELVYIAIIVVLGSLGMVLSAMLTETSSQTTAAASDG
jgi:Flp pilus assembly pilin Flp